MCPANCQSKGNAGIFGKVPVDALEGERVRRHLAHSDTLAQEDAHPGPTGFLGRARGLAALREVFSPGNGVGARDLPHLSRALDAGEGREGLNVEPVGARGPGYPGLRTTPARAASPHALELAAA